MAELLDEGGVTSMLGKIKRLSATKTSAELGSNTSHPQGHEGLSTHMDCENVGKKVKGAKKLVTWTTTLVTEEHGTEVLRVELIDDVFGKTKTITCNGHPVHPKEFKDKLGYAFMFDHERFSLEVHILASPKSKTADGHYILYVNKIAYAELTYDRLLESFAQRAAAAEAKEAKMDQVTLGIPLGVEAEVNITPFQLRDDAASGGNGGLNQPLLDLGY